MWLYRLLCCIKRYKPHLLTRKNWMNRAKLQEFPWPDEQMLFFPERHLLSRSIAKIGPCLRAGAWNVLNSLDTRFMRQLCKDRQIDIIHLHFGWLACAFLSATHKLGAPVVVSLYGADLFHATGKYLQQLKKLLLCRDVRFIVTSQALKNCAVRLGAEPDNVSVIPVGISSENLPDENKIKQQKLNRKTASPVKIISVGRLVEFKAPHMLPYVARILMDRGLDFEWILAGGGPLFEECVQNARTLDVSDKFIIKGDLPFQTINSLLMESDIMVHNAVVAPDGEHEALGVVLMEGGAVGLPVVSCRIGGIFEVIDNNKTGFLVESGDLEAMADKIMLLARDSAMRCQMGIAAMRYIREKFNSEKLAEQVEKLYDQMIPLF